MAVRRINKELFELLKKPSEYVSAGPAPGNDIYHWHGTIIGPENSPYSGGMFFVDIIFPSDYPFKPPKVTFMQRMYHPGINKCGGNNLDILKDQWSPALTIVKVLLCLHSMLADINEEDVLEPEIARVFKYDRKKFEETAREWTKKYAT